MARRKAISPVIATVIIVAVTIAVAIAVAFWMTGIIGLFTGFEQLQITTIMDDANQGIILTVRNTGTQTATITDVFINGRSCAAQLQCTINVNDQQQTPQNSRYTIVLNPGSQAQLVISFSADNAQQANLGEIGPGTSVEVKLLSATGKEYPKLLVLQQWSPQTGTGGG